jgi:hypothetical protein
MYQRKRKLWNWSKTSRTPATEISRDRSFNKQEEPESDEDQPKLQLFLPVSRQKTYQSFDRLRHYVEKNAIDPKSIQFCHQS